MTLGQYFSAWWRLSRIPFLWVGILPLILGFIVAWRWGYAGPAGLYLLSFMTVVLIMWMSYYFGEWNDLEGDRLNQTFNRFSGGSRVLVTGELPPRVSLLLGLGCLAGAILTGLIIYFKYRPGPWTLLLGILGLFFGFSYSGRPFVWSSRGIGEILIGFCYGWLPIATGFYLFTGFYSNSILILSLPVGLSIFNVILVNEFPDEEADRTVGKRNLVVRFGKERMGDLYMGLSILAGLLLIKALMVSGAIPLWLLMLAGIPNLIILSSLIQVLREDFRDPGRLERLCRKTLYTNLSITLILTIQQTLAPAVGGKPG